MAAGPRAHRMRDWVRPDHLRQPGLLSVAGYLRRAAYPLAYDLFAAREAVGAPADAFAICGMAGSSSPRTILFVGFITGIGGDAVQMLDLAVGMRDRGQDVRIALPEVDATAGFADRCRAMNVPVERSTLLRADILGPRQDARDVVRFLHSHQADLVHFHTGNDCLPRSVLFGMAALRAPKAFVTLHGPYASLRVGGVRARTWAAFARRTFRKVICPSESSVNAQVRYGLPVELLERIPNGVDVRKYARGKRECEHGPSSPSRPKRRSLSLHRGWMLRSGHSTSSKPSPRLQMSSQTSHLVFVGSGALEDEAKRSAGRSGLLRRVHFVGYRTDVPDWLAASTVWVLPTETESFGLAIVEALAAGCPVLTTFCAGTDEYLVDDGNALLCSVGDVEAMASRLRQLLSSPALRLRLAAEGRRTAQELSIERSLERYLAAYAAARL